ncbi:MAG TPA: APC family permease [Streptosporangiaceae bacterium]|nr:APC family permease [Streptosporangiaceae bacterium]
MTDRSAAAVAGIAPAPAARLQPDAIGVVQDTVIGMASSAPAATVGLSLAGLAVATAYGSGPILILTAIPMLIIANAYRRCNMWNANCGASFEWVGRAISPYLGFLTGWLMVAAYIIGTVAEVLLLGPSVLAVFGSNSTSTWADIGIGVAVGLVMLVIAVVGIRITARAQVSMALVEYLILIGLAVAGLVWVLGHHPGSVHITKGWFSLSGIGGHGSAVAGFLVAVFVYGGWDGTLYVNEEVKHRRTNPGRAAILAVGLLAIIYTFAQVGFQGVLSPAKLKVASANGTALVEVAQALGGGGWAKAMALSIALSVIATTGTGIVLSARIVYGMASYRALPEFLSNVSRRFATPVAASIIVGLLIVAISTVYYLATSVQNAFYDVINVTGLLFSIFYILTALAAIVYYRRRVFSGAWDFLILGLLPLSAAGFLGWILVQSLQTAGAAELWSMVGIVALGLILMLAARLVLRSPFFQIQRESDGQGRAPGHRRTRSTGATPGDR